MIVNVYNCLMGAQCGGCDSPISPHIWIKLQNVNPKMEKP